MTLIPATITNALLSMNVNPATVSPLTEALVVKEPINFAGIANLQVINGTFTPANNVFPLKPGGFDATNTPNFIIVICDAQLNIIVSGSIVDYVPFLPVQKVAVIMTPQLAGNYVSSVNLSGSTNPAAIAMAQGTPVNYTIIYGQATIS